MIQLNWIEFGARVRVLRAAQGISQQQLSEALHITVTHISKLETGARGPSISLVFALANHFNVSMDFLCGRASASKEEMVKSLDSIIVTCQQLRNNI